MNRRKFTRTLVGLACGGSLVKIPYHDCCKEYTKLLIDRAIEQNILCYDADAAPGVFTKRLISLMKSIAWRNREWLATDGDIGEYVETYVLYDEMLEYYLSKDAILATNDTKLVLQVYERGVLAGSC